MTLSTTYTNKEAVAFGLESIRPADTTVRVQNRLPNRSSQVAMSMASDSAVGAVSLHESAVMPKKAPAPNREKRKTKGKGRAVSSAFRRLEWVMDSKNAPSTAGVVIGAGNGYWFYIDSRGNVTKRRAEFLRPLNEQELAKLNAQAKLNVEILAAIAQVRRREEKQKQRAAGQQQKPANQSDLSDLEMEVGIPEGLASKPAPARSENKRSPRQNPRYAPQPAANVAVPMQEDSNKPKIPARGGRKRVHTEDTDHRYAKMQAEVSSRKRTRVESVTEEATGGMPAAKRLKLSPAEQLTALMLSQLAEFKLPTASRGDKDSLSSFAAPVLRRTMSLVSHTAVHGSSTVATSAPSNELEGLAPVLLRRTTSLMNLSAQTAVHQSGSSSKPKSSHCSHRSKPLTVAQNEAWNYACFAGPKALSKSGRKKPYPPVHIPPKSQQNQQNQSRSQNTVLATLATLASKLQPPQKPSQSSGSGVSKKNVPAAKPKRVLPPAPVFPPDLPAAKPQQQPQPRQTGNTTSSSSGPTAALTVEIPAPVPGVANLRKSPPRGVLKAPKVQVHSRKRVRFEFESVTEEEAEEGPATKKRRVSSTQHVTAQTGSPGLGGLRFPTAAGPAFRAKPVKNERRIVTVKRRTTVRTATWVEEKVLVQHQPDMQPMNVATVQQASAMDTGLDGLMALLQAAEQQQPRLPLQAANVHATAPALAPAPQQQSAPLNGPCSHRHVLCGDCMIAVTTCPDESCPAHRAHNQQFHH